MKELEQLRRDCDQAEGRNAFGAVLSVVEHFGDWAPWVLKPELIAVARAFHPLTEPSLQQLQRVGTCGVLFICTTPHSALQRAFFLPLQWVPKSAAHPASCPLDLHGKKVADVLRVDGFVLRPFGQVGAAAVELVCQPEITSWDSAWLPLALGLLSAQAGRPLNTGTLAAGAWSQDQGLTQVGNIEEKTELAIQLRAHRLLIPEGNECEARKVLGRHGGSLKLVPLGSGQVDFRELMRPVVTELLLEPAWEAAEQELQGYYSALRSHGKPDDADRWYERVLVPRIAVRLREQWLAKKQSGAEGEILVTVLSHSPSASFLAMAVVWPKRCFLLYTKDLARYLARLEEMLAWHRELLPPDFELRRLETASQDALLELIGRFREETLADVPGGRVVVDLTPGTKEMTLALFAEATRPSDYALYIRSQQDPARKPIPFTETLRVWQR
ncbi:MAG: hypothetical protein KatS3mg110_1992 [Pirellulaceae bacterium]|nr:MAG: hypothetical protein KatS3mg110_1992 [Pirellulaceae bacterium]